MDNPAHLDTAGPITFTNGPLPVEIFTEDGEPFVTVLPWETFTFTPPDERSRRNLLADFAMIERRQRIVEMLMRQRMAEQVKSSS